MLSLFSQSDSKPQDHKETSSFDLNSFVGSIAGSTQKNQSSGSKKGVESYLDVSSENVDRKKFVPSKSAAKPASKPSNTDDRKSKDSKDQSHSSQSHKNGHTDSSRGRDSSKDHRDSDKSKQSNYRGREEKKSNIEDYDPLGNKHEGGNGRSSNAYDDMPIKKKPADGHDGRNGEYSPKIKKVHEPSSPKLRKAEPSSPKIKKAEPSLVKRPEVSPAKPRPSQTPPSRPDGNSSINKSSTQNSSRPIPRKPDDSIPKKPQSGTSQPSSRPVSAKPTSSSPAPSRPSLGSKPTTPAGKPSSLSKPLPAKPSSMSQSPRPLGQKPGLNSSMGSKPVSKPGLGSKPVSSQSVIKKDFAVPTSKPGMRPVSQSPKPVPGKSMNGAPAESKEAMKRRMEMQERMRKEKMLQAKKLADSKMPSKPTTNLVKRPLAKPDSRMEPALIKKPKLSASEKKQTLNSIFKGAPAGKKKKHYDSEDDDYDDNDSFIDDGDDDADVAQNELNKIFAGYRKRVMMSKPYENDIDDMEAGFERIQAEEEWTKHVGEIEDRREAEFIKKEMEEEQAALMKRKRKLKI